MFLRTSAILKMISMDQRPQEAADGITYVDFIKLANCGDGESYFFYRNVNNDPYINIIVFGAKCCSKPIMFRF